MDFCPSCSSCAWRLPSKTDVCGKRCEEKKTVMFPGKFLTSAFKESQATSACAAVYVTGAVLEFHLDTSIILKSKYTILSSHSIMRKVLMPPAFPHCSSTFQLPLEKRLKEQLFLRHEEIRRKERLAMDGGTKDLFWIACSWDVSPISRGL